MAEAGYSSVEEQRVVVGHKECAMGFVVDDVALHVGLFFKTDVGWVADHYVEGCVCDCLCEYVALQEVDVCAVCLCVEACDVECFAAYVECRELCLWHLAFEGHGYTSAACADVEDVGCGVGRCVAAYELCEFVGLGARYECVGVYGECSSAEMGFTDYVLQWFVAGDACCHTGDVLLRAGVDGVGVACEELCEVDVEVVAQQCACEVVGFIGEGGVDDVACGDA